MNLFAREGLFGWSVYWGWPRKEQRPLPVGPFKTEEEAEAFIEGYSEGHLDGRMDAQEGVAAR